MGRWKPSWFHEFWPKRTASWIWLRGRHFSTFFNIQNSPNPVERSRQWWLPKVCVWTRWKLSTWLLVRNWNYKISYTFVRYGRSCSIKWRPICQKPATKGHNPNTPDYPQPDPHPNCDAGWFYLAQNEKCHFIDHSFISGWDAANSMCRGMNAELISINHPDLTNELRTHLVDPDAIGTYTFKHKIDKLLIYNLNLLSC